MSQPSPATSLAEWQNYSANPSEETLLPLENKARESGCYADMLFSMIQFLHSSGDWKVALHLSLSLSKNGYAVYSSYFAHVAVEKSAGDPLARLALAEALWDKRLVGAVLFETNALQEMARHLKNEAAKRVVLHEIAELNARSFAYFGNMAEARSWFLQASETGSIKIDTAVQMLFAESHTKNFTLGRIIVEALAPHEKILGQRASARLKKEARRQLVKVLARRPHEYP